MTTPLQLIATAGLLQNQGLTVNTAMLTSIATYESSSLIAPLISTIINGGNANIPPAEPPGPNVARFSNVTISKLNTMGASICPALSDTVPSSITGLTANTAQPGLTGLVKIGAATVYQASDVTKFLQAFGQAQGYVSQTNRVINTAKNSETFLGPTFNNMNSLTTGDLSAVSTNLQLFGTDLGRLGKLWNFGNFNEFGSPAAVFRQILTVGGIPTGILEQMALLNIEESQVTVLRRNDEEIADSLQVLLYRVMQAVGGETLSVVLAMLDIETANIVNMADLLNPVKLFPNSFLTLLAPTPPTPIATDASTSTTRATYNIYINNTGAVNTNLVTQLPSYLIRSTSPGMPYERLRAIVPADQALASKALQASLNQIKNINNLTVDSLADSVVGLETNTGLTLINALTEAVPASVRNYVLTTVASGTGPGNTLTMGDVMGTMSGYRITQPMANTVSLLANVNTSALASIYLQMSKVANLEYGASNVDIPSGPGAGSYGSLDDAMGNLCNLANANISTIASANSVVTSQLNSNFITIATTVRSQSVNLAGAAINYANLTANLKSVVSSWTEQLHQYGLDITPGGTSEFITSVANTQNLTGQAIAGSLREGRNLAKLDNGGVGTNAQIPSG